MAENGSRVKVTRSFDTLIVEFADRKILDELCIAEIQDELVRLVDGTPDVKLILSFGNVEHLSSAALGMLITLNKKVHGKSGALKLCDIKPQILEVFNITRLNKMFDIQPDLAAAKAGFQA